MFLSKLTWQAYKLLAARPIAELDRFRSLKPAEQRLEMAGRLLAQIQYFGARADALPEWREAASIRNPLDLWKIWAQLPVVTKPLLNTLFEPVEMTRRFRLQGRISSTGGSTGEPTRFFLDKAMLRASRGVHLYTQQKMGWRPSMQTIVVWGSERDIGKTSRPLQRIAQKLYGARMIPGFGIDQDTVAGIIHIIRKDAPVAIYGFSSLLEYVARQALASGEELPPHSVAAAWNGGEMLYENQVQLFKRAFGVPILNRYGGRELSAIAFQEAEGAPLRLLRPWIFAEIVDEAGMPAPAGQPGRLLLTSTICRGTPFLRYEIGDLGEYTDSEFDESGIRSIAMLHGRHAGAINLPDGKIVSALYWNHLLKDYPEATQFQVRFAVDGSIKILLVGNGFTDARSQQLRDTLRLVWHDRKVELEWTNSIPRSAQGKLIQVVQES